jgi:hypothetical protein
MGPNMASGRYSSGTDAKHIDNVQIQYQEDLVTPDPIIPPSWVGAKPRQGAWLL